MSVGKTGNGVRMRDAIPGPRTHRCPHIRSPEPSSRCRRGPGSRRHPRASGDGVRGVGRASARHRTLCDHRLPVGIRSLRSLAHSRARTRLVHLTDDLCRSSAPPRSGGRAQRDRSRRNVGPDRRSHRDRARRRQTGVRRRPPLERSPGRIHERSRPRDHRRAVAEALRLRDRRRRLRSRSESLLSRTRRHRRASVARRTGRPGHPDGAPAVHAQPSGRLGGDRRRYSRLSRPGSPCSRCPNGGHAAAWTSQALTAVDQGGGRGSPDGRGHGHHPGFPGRHHRHLLELRCPAWRGSQTEPGDDRHRRCQPGLERAPGVRRVDERITDRRCRAGRSEDSAFLCGRCRRRDGPAPVLQFSPVRPAPVSTCRGTDHRGRSSCST